MNKFLIAFFLSLLSFVTQAEPVLWACRSEGVTIYLSVDDRTGTFVMFNANGQYISSNKLEIIRINNKNFYMSVIGFTDDSGDAREVMISISANKSNHTLLLELKGVGDEDYPIVALECI